MLVTRIGAALFVGAALTLSAGGVAHAAPAGQVQEDDPGWDCRVDGNRICGPTNAQAVPAGCYADTGALVAAWPCHLVVNPDGSADVYTGAAVAR